MPLRPQTQPKTLRYDPFADLAERWPSWRIQRKPLPDAAEAFLWDEQIIELDSDYFNEDPRLAVAHAVAHLDLHSDTMPEVFTYDGHCCYADFYAELRLDEGELLQAS
jgi:hypothetical protein